MVDDSLREKTSPPDRHDNAGRIIDIKRRITELRRANEQATTWGAAVGARSSEITRLERELEGLKPKGSIEVNEDDWQMIISAIENMRSADKDDRTIEARFELAYKLAQFNKRIYEVIK